jgi:hypothetical protein
MRKRALPAIIFAQASAAFSSDAVDHGGDAANGGASLNAVQGVLSPAIRLAYELLIGSLSSSV